jgi:hypothetical protein
LVKDMIGAEAIAAHEVSLAHKALQRLSRHPKIQVLGPIDVDRLAIISLNIEGLHHDLVAILLDHLFGIQNRAGCSCAGPYGHRLLGIDRDRSEQFRQLIRRGFEGIKPGWVRVTIPFYSSQEDVEYLLSAIEFVADHGQQFLPLYRLDWHTGVWQHLERPAPDMEPIELTVEALEEAAQSFAAGDHEAPMSEEQVRAERARYRDEAQRSVEQLQQRWRNNPPVWNPPSGCPEVDAQVWFRYVHASTIDA